MDKYSLEVQKIISLAESIAFNFGHSLVGSEHLLLAFLKNDTLLTKELKNYKISYETIYKKIRNLYPSHEDEPIYMEYTLELKKLLENALIVSKQYHESQISLTSLSIAMLIYEDSLANDLLKKFKVDVYQISQRIDNKYLRKSELDNVSDLHNLSLVKSDPLIGREDEMQQLINALSRRNKPNAILVGEPGVGKTALVEELAKRLYDNKIPSLSGKMIYELDLAATVGGTKYRGEFEEKVKKILKKVIDDGNAILFIDEIHNIIKAGGAEGAIDASNILKPYLSRNEIQIIGATTEDEFQTIFEKDKALKRRFQVIKMLPSDKEETKNILKQCKSLYEKHYHLLIDDSLLDYIVDITANYLPSLFFPDKAIDVLDNSCVIANTSLTKEDIDKTMESYYKINVNLSSKCDKVLKLIENKIIGQESSINKIKEALTLIDNNFYDKDRPLLSMLFVGPSGVGKTEISKIIGQVYFGEENIIYFDMSSYQEINSLNKLIGYSSQDNPKLVRELKAHPKCLIILDEIEKASNEVLDFFLQILDQGFFDSTKGEKIDCKNAMIIMTSNYGFDSNLSFKMNLDNKKVTDDYINKRLQNRFRFEFLSRIDEIVTFSFLNSNNQRIIAEKYLSNLGVEISSFDDVLIHSQEDYDKYGARLIKKDCRKAILNKYKEKMKN